MMVIGDTAGNNELCAHYLRSAATCVTKDCKCKFDDLVECSPTKCSQISWEDLNNCRNKVTGRIDDLQVFGKCEEKNLISLKSLSEIQGNVPAQKEISYHDVRNAFDELPLADPYLGIVGITPQ